MQVILPPSISEEDIQTLLFKEMQIDNAEYKNMLIFS